MIGNTDTLNIVRIGSDITYSSLKEIGNRILDAFRGIVEEFKLFHHDSPVVDAVDAQLLTMVLHQEFGGHTLGITDADLKTKDKDEFYNTIFGGKNPRNDVAVVSTKKLHPHQIETEAEYILFLDRTLKVSIHEVGHNLGLTDHASFKTAADGTLCPMSRGEYNKFGYRGYVRAIIDGRGVNFCDDCRYFLKRFYRLSRRSSRLRADGIKFNPPSAGNRTRLWRRIRHSWGLDPV